MVRAAYPIKIKFGIIGLNSRVYFLSLLFCVSGDKGKNRKEIIIGKKLGNI